MYNAYEHKSDAKKQKNILTTKLFWQFSFIFNNASEMDTESDSRF